MSDAKTDYAPQLKASIAALAETKEMVPSKAKGKTKLMPPAHGEVTMLSLLDRALQNHAAIDVIERLAALQEKTISREAEVQFNAAMSAAQSEITRVAPDLNNPQTSSKYASFAALDRVLRPVYTKHGFALSFDEGDCPVQGAVRVLCYVSHIAGHTRVYRKDMPMPIEGPKGNAVMTKTHGAAAADSYGMRYILRKVFNVAIGEADNDGNAQDLPGIDDHLKAIEEACAYPVLREHFARAFKEAKLAKNLGAEKVLVAAYEKRKKELQEVEPA